MVTSALEEGWTSALRRREWNLEEDQGGETFAVVPMTVENSK